MPIFIPLCALLLFYNFQKASDNKEMWKHNSSYIFYAFNNIIPAIELFIPLVLLWYYYTIGIMSL